MPELKLLKGFSCWNCGETETVTGKAIEGQVKLGKMAPGLFYSLRKVVVPLKEPAQAQFTVPVIIVHYDACYKCGIEYITRVETMDAPLKFQPGPSDNFGLPPFFGIRG